MVEPGLSGKKNLDAEVNDPVEGGAKEPQEPEEGEIVDAIPGEIEEVHSVDEEPPISEGGIDKVEDEGNKELENEDNEAIDIGGDVGEQHKAGNNEEDMYKWIEDVRKTWSSLRVRCV